MVERKVRFFRATDGDLKLLAGGFPAAEVLRLLREMVKDGEPEVNIGGGQKLVAKPLRSPPGAKARHMVLYRVSSDDLPLLYENRRFRPLSEVINRGADLAEPAHFAFFPDDVLAHLYNHHGPKERQLAAYLLTTMKLDVLFGPIMRDDVLESIAEAGGVTLFNIRARVDELARFDGLPLSGMKSLSAELPIGDVEVILRATTPDQRHALAEAMVPLAQSLLSPSRRAAIKRAKVQLDDTDELSEDRLVDLLDDKLGLSQDVDTVPGQKRFLEESSAMQALEEAHAKVVTRL